MTFFCSKTANRKSRIAKLLVVVNIIAPSYRHVVHNPINKTLIDLETEHIVI